jgi:hypothetical protein
MSDQTVEDFLAHYGVQGMRWGVRKARPESGPPIKGLEKFPGDTAAAVTSVSDKMSKAYGFRVSEVIPIEGSKQHKYFAWVDAHSGGLNTIHLNPTPNYKKELEDRIKSGWFPPAGGHPIEANLTHEAAHSMLHTTDIRGKSFVGRLKVNQPIEDVRKRAWRKATDQAAADGLIRQPKSFLGPLSHPEVRIPKLVSRYANSSLMLEETEAEMFSSYHWNPNPPKFVDAFVSEVHKSMGVDVQPFSGRRVL